MAMRRLIKVSLSKQKSKKYTYWCLRWFGSDGRQRGKSIGRADGPNKLSRRVAELIRARKEQEINDRPGRRDVERACTLSSFLDFYISSRKSELMPSTLKLHRQTAKYLLAFFGSARHIDFVTRAEARAFKNALANGDLMHIHKSPQKPRQATVDRHIREARTMFNFALEVDMVLANPFDKLSCQPRFDRSWHYVTQDDYKKLVEFAPNIKWRLLISLCRLAALRRGEALHLEWSDIDWANHRLCVVAKKDWQPKDKTSRTVPIFPELYKLLLDAYNNAEAGQTRVIEGFCVTNTWRDFVVLCRRAGVTQYSKPFHTLRKNCITDWAAKFPAHVVKEWAGHSDLRTTDRYYLQVSELEYKRAAGTNFFDDFAQLFAQLGKNKKVDKSKESCIDLLQKEI